MASLTRLIRSLIHLHHHAVPPPELGLGPTPRWRIGIFLSLVHVHVNRIPADGTNQTEFVFSRKKLTTGKQSEVTVDVARVSVQQRQDLTTVIELKESASRKKSRTR